MKEFAFGVDIGGTTVKIGLFTNDGTVVEKWEIPTRTENGGENVLPDIAVAIRSKMDERHIGYSEVEGIGIGVPGPVGADGTVFKCVNLGWGYFNVKEKMNSLLPEIENVCAGNDANVAALGEMWMGGGRGHKNVVMFTLGTGVGGGVVLDGKILAGINGAGGEVGHMCINPDETVQCACGNYGCLEQYSSANGIVRYGKLILEKMSAVASTLRGVENLTSKDICEAAEAGDALAQQIVEGSCGMLGRAMALVANVVDPEVFVVGGGMSKAGAIVTDNIERAYHKYAFHVSKHTPIVLAELGNDAGIYGSAKMLL